MHGDVVTAELAALLVYGHRRIAQRRLARLVDYGLLSGFWAANRQRPRGRYAYGLTRAPLPGRQMRTGMKRLPATVEDLAGARAARWIRESTPGQFDRYGPEAQVEFQDRAITRLGLVDSGLAWRAAHSGRTVYRSAEMADMLGAA